MKDKAATLKEQEGDKALLKHKTKNDTRNDEDEDDSSDEELLVRTGNVPRVWYKNAPHLGYDIDAKKIKKEEDMDEVEKFLKTAESKDWWRNIYDEMNNKTIYISDKDLELINRIRKNLYVNKSAGEEDYFERDIPYQIHPLSNHIPSKKAFEMSKNERKIINRLVYLFKNGLMSLEPKVEEKEHLYDLWTYETSDPSVYHPGKGFQAPKREMPETSDSYNPTGDSNVALRKIPKYEQMFEEEFERCCDLFLSARVIKKKLDIKESDILPDLPKPEELKPFPTKENVIYKGHTSSIRSLALDPKGKFLISGDTGGFIHFWDVSTAKILKRIDVSDSIVSITCNPVMNLVTICGKESAYFVLPPYLERNIRSDVMRLITEKIYPLIEAHTSEFYTWKIPKKDSKKSKDGVVFYIKWKEGVLENLIWHNKGDYFATFSKNSLGKTQVYIHSLSKLIHQTPFSKIKGNVNAISFHPNKPYFIVATNSNIFVYNLQKQEMVRKFVSNLNTITHVSIHKNGYDILAGSKDGKVAWFQLELSDKPYKIMDYHGDKIKSISYHNNFPLFFSCSRNGKLLVYHGNVKEDAIQDPLIVPLKVLKPTHTNNTILVNAVFHNRNPWIFTSGEDNLIRLWS